MTGNRSQPSGTKVEGSSLVLSWDGGLELPAFKQHSRQRQSYATPHPSLSSTNTVGVSEHLQAQEAIEIGKNPLPQ